jgi:hypothetical protein
MNNDKIRQSRIMAAANMTATDDYGPFLAAVRDGIAISDCDNLNEVIDRVYEYKEKKEAAETRRRLRQKDEGRPMPQPLTDEERASEALFIVR